MKRTVLIAAFFVTLISASAYTGYNGPNSEMHIMNDNTSSSTLTSIERNGTGWRMTFEEVQTTTQNISTGVLNHSFDNYTVSFQGVIRTPTPCHSLEAQISNNGKDSYTYNITSYAKKSNNSCEQVISYRKYNATFKADRPFKIGIMHSNKGLDVLEHPEFRREGELEVMPGPRPEKGPIQKLVSWVKDLFSDEPERISAGEVHKQKISEERIVIEKDNSPNN